MLIAFLVVCFLFIFCSGCVVAYTIGYRKGRDKAVEHFARLFAKGVRTWLIEDFELQRGENSAILER